MILDEVTDHLHPGRSEGPDGRAQDVEVTGEVGIRYVVDAWVERDSPFALRSDSVLDRVDDIRVGEVDRAHVVPGEEQEIEGRGSHGATICETEARW